LNTFRADRRRFLAGGASAALILASSHAGAARAPAITEQTLAPGVRLLTGPAGNSVAIDTAEGVVLVDGGGRAEARELLRRARADRRRIAMLVNTHWHPGVTGCNEALGREGVPIVAQENTRLWLQRPIVKVLEGERHDPLPKVGWPGRGIEDREELRLGDVTLECGHLFQAHTDGDLYVRIPGANVIVAGGTVAVGHYPILDTFTGGWIRGMLNATKALVAVSDERTQLVGETGAVVGKAHLEAQAEMLETLTERLWQLMRKGLSEEDLLAAEPTKDYDGRWGDPREFVLNSYRGIWGHVREMRGIV
jgi:cyclase